MFARILAGPVLAMAVLACVAPAARADFTLVSQDLDLSQKDQQLHVTLAFNQAPNFTSVDAEGRPANSFQIEFDGAVDPTTALPTDLTAIVRGDEIHVANTVNVRSPTGDGGANSGGWGPIIDSVAYSLTGNTVSFSVPLSDLGWAGGDWSATIFSLDTGSLTAQQTVTSVPTPPAFWAGLAGLTVVAGLSVRRSMVRRRSAGYLVG